MNLHIIDHPLVKHKLALMREADCSTYKFRTLTNELARHMKPAAISKPKPFPSRAGAAKWKASASKEKP